MLVVLLSQHCAGRQPPELEPPAGMLLEPGSTADVMTQVDKVLELEAGGLSPELATAAGKLSARDTMAGVDSVLEPGTGRWSSELMETPTPSLSEPRWASGVMTGVDSVLEHGAGGFSPELVTAAESVSEPGLTADVMTGVDSSKMVIIAAIL